MFGDENGCGDSQSKRQESSRSEARMSTMDRMHAQMNARLAGSALSPTVVSFSESQAA
jgi:hypothetical protein